MNKFKLLIIFPLHKFYEIDNNLIMLNFWKKYFFLFMKHSFPKLDIGLIGDFNEIKDINNYKVLKRNPDLIIYFLETLDKFEEAVNLYDEITRNNPHIQFLILGPYANMFAGIEKKNKVNSCKIIMGNNISQITSFISDKIGCKPVFTSWKELFNSSSKEIFFADIARQEYWFFENKSVFVNLTYSPISMDGIEKTFWTDPICLPPQISIELIKKKIIKNGIREIDFIDKDLLFDKKIFLNLLELLKDVDNKASFSGLIEAIKKLDEPTIKLMKDCNFKHITFTALATDHLPNVIKESGKILSSKLISTKVRIYLMSPYKRYSYAYIDRLANLFAQLGLINCKIALQRSAKLEKTKSACRDNLYGHKLVGFFELKKILNKLRI